MDPVDVTEAVTQILEGGGKADTIGYLCIQGGGSRICSGCTSGCDQSVILLYSTDKEV